MATTGFAITQRAIASVIEETLRNGDWALGKPAADAEITVERINHLLEGDRYLVGLLLSATTAIASK